MSIQNISVSDLNALVKMVNKVQGVSFSVWVHDFDLNDVPEQFEYQDVSADGTQINFQYKPHRYSCGEITLFCKAPIVTWYFSGMTTSPKTGQPYEAKNEKHETPLVEMIRALNDGIKQNWFDRAHAEKVCKERNVDVKFLDYDFSKQLPF